ncbi:MFS transporter [Cellulomonas denverensis]|uniref:MFS transporter n=1 Tax=Cellulomonas denverensis TaxID=264297 RepID=A0A7X6KTD9_9CELL|nr:MFS transporter [Cellulomonas denverensis]NKY21957.1 MFS transporter [Cellulomonas denverensis]GIG24150.1 MFS transporter [Cellulomonas denverensis]
MPTALAVPAYRRLFTAQAISLVGTGLTTVALGLLAYDLAGGRAGLVLGTVFAIKMLAYVAVAPVAAALVHATPPRTVLVTADLVRVAVVLGLPWVTSVSQVYPLVLVLQAASAVHTPAYQAALPQVLTDQRRYTEALSLSRLSEDLEMILSPLLGAALLLVLPSSDLFIGTAAGFAISALLVSRLRLTRPAPAQDGATTFAARAGRGIALMSRTPELRAVLALNLVVAAGGAYVLVQYVVLARETFGRGEGTAALLMAALGAGSIVVAVLLPRVLDALPERVVMLGGGGVLVLATALLAAAVRLPGTGGLVLVGGLFAVIGAGWAAAETPVGRLITRTTGEADRPAVFAAQFSLSHACWLITYPLAGWLGALGLGSSALILAVLGAIALAATAVAWPATEPAANVAR